MRVLLVKKSWSIQDAKACFSEFLKASLTEGPQVVTLRGVETAVLVRVNEWRDLHERRRFQAIRRLCHQSVHQTSGAIMTRRSLRVHGAPLARAQEQWQRPQP